MISMAHASLWTHTLVTPRFTRFVPHHGTELGNQREMMLTRMLSCPPKAQGFWGRAVVHQARSQSKQLERGPELMNAVFTFKHHPYGQGE